MKVLLVMSLLLLQLRKKLLIGDGGLLRRVNLLGAILRINVAICEVCEVIVVWLDGKTYHFWLETRVERA